MNIEIVLGPGTESLNGLEHIEWLAAFLSSILPQQHFALSRGVVTSFLSTVTVAAALMAQHIMPRVLSNEFLCFHCSTLRTTGEISRHIILVCADMNVPSDSPVLPLAKRFTFSAYTIGKPERTG